MLNFELSIWEVGDLPSAPGAAVERDGTSEGFYHEESLKSALNTQRNFFDGCFFSKTNTVTFKLFESKLEKLAKSAKSEKVKLG